MSNEPEHLLDILISDYYRVCELNHRVPILIEYRINTKGNFNELILSINRKLAGLYNFSTVDACKDAIVQSYFIKGIEAWAIV